MSIPHKDSSANAIFCCPPARRCRRCGAPVLTVVAAKKNDIENGIGQCLAEMAGARLFNQRAGQSGGEMHGCVTTGEAWQFVRLHGNVAQIDLRRYYIDNAGAILAVLLEVVSRGAVPR